MKKFVIVTILFCVLLLGTCHYAMELSSPNAILIDVDSGKILYEKEAYTKVYPASTTKVLTCLMALENCDLEDEVTASYNAIMSVPYDGSTAAIQVGEVWTVQELLEAMLVCSANEAANMMAEYIGGSTESFASMMNTRAKELGAKNTNFVNANGLHDDKHVTTVYDMALITRYAVQHYPIFKEIASMQKFSLPNTSVYTKGDRTFSNTNKLIIPSSSYYYPYATGIKTGYTSKALNCIIASAEKDGVELIAVVFGSVGASNRTEDVKALFEYGFETLKSEKFLLAGQVIDNIKIPGASNENGMLLAVSSSNVIHTIPADKTMQDYEPTITMNEDLKAPISSGDIVGTITYDIEGNIYEYDLVASHKVDSFLGNVATVAIKATKAVGKVVFWAVMSVLAMFIAFIFVRATIISNKQRTRRMRRRNYNARFRR